MMRGLDLQGGGKLASSVPPMLRASGWRMLPNPADLATAKPMVQMKNLFRQKDGLGPCLEDAEVKWQLSVHNKLRYQICHLFYGGRLYTEGERG
jgi:hypothetical protein